MKRTVLLLALLCAFCAGTSTGWALNEWTYLIYMSNDDNKSSAIEDANITNLKNMQRVALPAGVEVLVQVDGREGKFFDGMFGKKPGSGCFRYNVKGGELVQEEKLGEVNLGNPQVFWDFLKWGAQKHPAKHYGLIFNSHGSGVFSWRGTGGTSSVKPGAVEFDPGRFVAYDDTDNDCLTVFEVKAVMQAFREKLNGGRKLDVVGFDACLPGAVEVLYQFRDVAEVLVGSPDTIPIDGFNYRAILESLAKKPGMSAEEFGALHAQKFSQRVMGAWRTSKAQEVAFSFNNLAIEVLKALNESKGKLSFSGIQSFGGKDRYWSMLEVVAAIDKQSQDWNASNKAAIRPLITEVKDAVAAARITDFGLMTVARPVGDEYKQFRAFYKALDFAGQTQWDEILDYLEGMK